MDIFNELLSMVGTLWLVAIIGAAIATLFEASNPDKGAGGGAMQTVNGLLSVITPFLLFVHAFIRIAHALGLFGNMSGLGDVVQSTLAFALYAIMAALLFGPILPGLAIRKAAPELGRTLFGISTWVHVAVFVLTLVITLPSVLLAFRMLGL